MNRKLLYQDIQKLCRENNTLFGVCDKLHKYDKNGRPTELPKFLAQAEQLMGKEALINLMENDIICPATGGNYDFHFTESVLSGGGLTYSNIGKTKDNQECHAVMVSSDKNDDDRQVIYHEFGHILQKKLNLFNTKDLHTMYQFMNKGLKKISYGQLNKMFVQDYIYHDYLQEIHADTFSHACLLLRAEKTTDFYRQYFKNYLQSGQTYMSGILTSHKEYPSDKFYAYFPCDKAMMKEISQWRKNGKIKEYTSPNGEIDFDKLAQKTADIVKENAFTPREFANFLNNRLTRSADDPKWYQFAPEAFLSQTLNIYHIFQTYIDGSKKMCQHLIIDKKYGNHTYKPLPESDPQAKLVNLACRLDNLQISFNMTLKDMNLNLEDSEELELKHAINYGKFPDNIINTAREELAAQDKSITPEINILLHDYQTRINNILNTEYDPKELTALMHGIKDYKKRDALWQMYNERRNNPSSAINPESLMEPEVHMSPQEQKQQSYYYYRYIKQFLNNDLLPSDDVDSKTSVQSFILKTMKQNPDLLKEPIILHQATQILNQSQEPSKEQKDSIHLCLNNLHCLYFMDPQTFKQTIQDYQDNFLPPKTLTHRHPRNNPYAKYTLMQRRRRNR